MRSRHLSSHTYFVVLTQRPIAYINGYRGGPSWATTCCVANFRSEKLPLRREKRLETPLIGIVDHDLASSRLADQALAAEGYRTLLLLDGSDAFYTIRQERPDVIIVNPAPDAPELDWGLLHLLRRDSSTKDTPVLICSPDAAAFQQSVEDLQGPARLSIVNKSASSEELITAVRDLLA